MTTKPLCIIGDLVLGEPIHNTNVSVAKPTHNQTR